MLGPGGSGKSTLVAYALENGWLTNGDDYVLVDLNGNTPKCWTVYRTLKIHPSNPVLFNNKKYSIWRRDKSFGKSILVSNSYKEGGLFIVNSNIVGILGLKLAISQFIHNPKAQSIVLDPERNHFLHCYMSTIQQIPYCVNETVKLSKTIHQITPYKSYKMSDGLQGLKKGTEFLENFVKQIKTAM